VDTLLRSLASNRDVPGWEETAMNWLIAVIVIAVAGALIMVFTKALRKKAASGPITRMWNPSQSVMFILAALLPLALIVWGAWYFSINFHSIAGVPGLLKGIFISWLLYTTCMVIAHLGPWRKELF